TGSFWAGESVIGATRVFASEAWLAPSQGLGSWRTAAEARSVAAWSSAPCPLLPGPVPHGVTTAAASTSARARRVALRARRGTVIPLIMDVSQPPNATKDRLTLRRVA